MFSAALLGRDLIRVHLVDKEENPLYHSLLTAAGKANGLPVLYNTSFNLFGDPLVCTPRDAVRSFYSSGIDALFVGSFLFGEVSTFSPLRPMLRFGCKCNEAVLCSCAAADLAVFSIRGAGAP